MTEKNADVEWLRHEVTLGTALIVGRVRARRLLAHIDALEAEKQGEKWESIAAEAYRGAEALVAEGRRRDGL